MACKERKKVGSLKVNWLPSPKNVGAPIILMSFNITSYDGNRGLPSCPYHFDVTSTSYAQRQEPTFTSFFSMALPFLYHK